MPAGFRSVKVETGLASDTYVEITSGLSEGDVVYVAESSKTAAALDDDGRRYWDPPGGGRKHGRIKRRAAPEAARTVKVCSEGTGSKTEEEPGNTWTITSQEGNTY